MMLTPQDVLKIIEGIEGGWGISSEIEDFTDAYNNACAWEGMWGELKDKLEKMRVLR